jgi:RNA polymerase sigma-70 factor (ECF subfamily)
MTHRLPLENQPASPHLPEPNEWLERYGDELYRYAVSRLRSSHEAEDAVQEALLAAYKARARFQGNSQPLSWLIGILKRKILDRLRARARHSAATNPADLDAWFDAGGHWRRAPKRWGDPSASAEYAEFWRVVQDCLSKLPARMAAAFTLRSIEEEKADAVCRELAISPANLWVLLHRARLGLVRCLEMNWFNVEHRS